MDMSDNSIIRCNPVSRVGNRNVSPAPGKPKLSKLFCSAEDTVVVIIMSLHMSTLLSTCRTLRIRVFAYRSASTSTDAKRAYFPPTQNPKSNTIRILRCCVHCRAILLVDRKGPLYYFATVTCSNCWVCLEA